jgi:hypothetical protein
MLENKGKGRIKDVMKGFLFSKLLLVSFSFIFNLFSQKCDFTPLFVSFSFVRNLHFTGYKYLYALSNTLLSRWTYCAASFDFDYDRASA